MPEAPSRSRKTYAAGTTTKRPCGHGCRRSCRRACPGCPWPCRRRPDLVAVLATGLVVGERRLPCRCRRRSCRRACPRRPGHRVLGLVEEAAHAHSSSGPVRRFVERGLGVLLLLAGRSSRSRRVGQLGVVLARRLASHVVAVGSSFSSGTGAVMFATLCHMPDAARARPPADRGRRRRDRVRQDRTSPSTSPSASAARWSTPTRCRSTAAWTSVRRSCRSPSVAASRTTCSTRSTSATPPRWRSSRAGRARPSPTCAPPAGPRCWSAARRSTRGRSWTASSSPATDDAVRARLEEELAERRARPPCTSGSARSTPRRPTGCWSRTAAARSARSRSSRSPAGPTAPRLPTLEYADPHTIQIGVDIDRPTLDARIARRVDLMFDAGLRRRGRAAARPRAWPTGGPRRSRSATARWSPYLRGELSLDEARQRTDLRDPAVRAASGRLVPQGPADRLAAVRRPRPGRAGGVGGARSIL